MLPSPVTTFPRGGLFVQRLQSCVFHESRGAEGFVPHTLPVDGPFTSLSIEPETRHFLVSSRPSSNHQQVYFTIILWIIILKEINTKFLSLSLLDSTYSVCTDVVADRQRSERHRRFVFESRSHVNSSGKSAEAFESFGSTHRSRFH